MGLIPSISNNTGISPIPTSYTVTLHIFIAIYSPAVAYRVKTPVHARGKVYDAAKATIQLSFKLTINKMWTHTDIYIHIYIQDLRIAPHSLHDYLPITNALSNKVIEHSLAEPQY